MRDAWWLAAVLLASMGCGASRAPHGSPQVSEARVGQVPETPSRQAVVEAMNAVTPAVRACGRGVSGDVSVRFVFANSGVASDVSINPGYSWGAAQPGPECEPTPDSSGYYSCTRAREPVPEVDSCIIQAARAARVPPFAHPSFSVNFPFRY